MLSPREGGGGGVRATHWAVIVRSVSRVGILMVRHIPRVGIATSPDILVVKGKKFSRKRDCIRR